MNFLDGMKCVYCELTATVWRHGGSTLCGKHNIATLQKATGLPLLDIQHLMERRG